MTQTLALDDITVKFEIWDTAGQERYHSLAPMYYRGAQAAVVVYDVTSQDSFERAQRWISELRDQANKDIVIALAGNKIDLCHDTDLGDETLGGNGDVDGTGDSSAIQNGGNGNASNSRRSVEREEAQAYANENKLIFFETSAKTGESVHELFLQIANDLPKNNNNSRGGNNGNRQSNVNLNNRNSNGDGENVMQKCCNN